VRNLKPALAALALLVMVGACGKSKEEPAPAAPAGGGSAAATPFDPATGTATVSGKIAFEGAAPPAAQIKMTADPVCLSLHKEPVTSEEVLVADGKLQNVFVYVKEGLEKYSFTPPAEPAKINQEGCHYMPHVGGMMVNQKLKIINSDSTLHNIHCWAEKNPQFNIGQPVKGMETEKTFTTPEILIHFKCDVHKWMSAYLGVLTHPYYSVTGKDGAFTLKNLPPGDYVIEAWHEKYGTQTQKVTVADKDSKEVAFTFKAT
jgi:hypothetical protein